MIIIAIVNDKAEIVHHFADENDRNITVNGNCYLDLINEVIRLTFCSSATHKGYWWMAPQHTAQQKLKVFSLKCLGTE